jgi:hypothetical protein
MIGGPDEERFVRARMLDALRSQGVPLLGADDTADPIIAHFDGLFVSIRLLRGEPGAPFLCVVSAPLVAELRRTIPTYETGAAAHDSWPIGYVRFEAGFTPETANAVFKTEFFVEDTVSPKAIALTVEMVAAAARDLAARLHAAGDGMLAPGFEG